MSLLRGFAQISAVPRFYWLDAMAYTAADLETVQQARITIARDGVARVTIDGESIEVLSLTQLQALENDIREDMVSTTASSVGPFNLHRAAMKPPGGGG